jgi:ssDNA-binding Zn-finger/Zn-ribbon topoisomerase 1
MEITEATAEYIDELIVRKENNFETDILCPCCSGQLVVRENSVTGHKFLGCTNYPDCIEIITVKRFELYYEDLHILDDPKFMNKAYSNQIYDDDYNL